MFQDLTPDMAVSSRLLKKYRSSFDTAQDERREL